MAEMSQRADMRWNSRLFWFSRNNMGLHSGAAEDGIQTEITLLQLGSMILESEFIVRSEMEELQVAPLPLQDLWTTRIRNHMTTLLDVGSINVHKDSIF